MAKSLTIADLVYRLGFDNEDQFVASLEELLKRAEDQVEKGGGDAGKKGGRAAGRGFSEQFRATFSGAAIGSFIGTALSQAFSGALQASKRFVQDSVREFATYEQGLLQLQLAGEKNLGALSKRIQDTARATRVFSATDVSLAVGDLVKAGFDVETAFALVETGALGAASEVEAATGRFGDLSATAGQLGNILRALGYDTSQTGRVMDVLARAAQDSNLDVSDLVDIVARVGPTAKLAGLEIEDLAAQAAVLSNNGMEASLIGTGLRSVLQSLINPSGQMKGQLDALGISLVDSEGNLRDFNEVLDGLHELTQRGGEGLQILTQATGSYGSTAAASLGSASETVKEFRANMENAEGSAQALADTMRNSAAGAAAELEARLADARAELGEQLVPILLDLHETILPALVGVLGEVIQLWTDWQFIITGTTTAIKQSTEATQQALVDRLGPELAGALNTLMDARQRVADAERALANERFDYGLGHRRREAELRQAQEELAVAQERYDLLIAQRRVQQDLANWEAPQQFGPQLPGQAGPEGEAAAVEDLAESYRNLATVRAELAEWQQRFETAASQAEEDAAAERVQALKREERALLDLIEVRQAAARASATVTDPLVAEAGRVGADLARLKWLRESGRIDAEQYEWWLAAHLRRLAGMWEEADTPERRSAVLRAESGFLTELDRLGRERADAERRTGELIADERERQYQEQLAAHQTMLAQEEARQAEIDRIRERLLDEGWANHAANELARQQLSEDAARQAAANERAIHEERERQLDQQWANHAANEDTRRAAEEAAARQALENERAIHEERERQLDQQWAMHLANEEQRRADEAILRQRYDDALLADAAGVAEQLALLEERKYATALGATVRLTKAQQALGHASREDVARALEAQLAAIEALLPSVEEGSDRYYELAEAASTARRELDALAVSLTIKPTVEVDTSEADALRKLEAQREQLRASVEDIALSFPRALIVGIQTGDLEGALKGALGSATDFFLDQMLKAILGPIAQQMAAAMVPQAAAGAASGAAGAAGAAAGLGPWGWVIGGGLLLASLLASSGSRRQAQQERTQQSVSRAVSSAPAITYNLTANVRVDNAGSWSDPAFYSRWRSETEALVVSLLSKVRKEPA